MTLQGTHICLRALEATDLDFLFNTENNELFWEISNTQLPFSKHILQRYIEQSHQDIYQAKQYRFVIGNTEGQPVGLIDLFDFDPHHHRAGVGILVLPKHQQKGYGTEALKLLINYAFSYLNLHQLYANISADNLQSRALFEKYGFLERGCKKDWIYTRNTYKDEIFYQLVQPTDRS
ncbi:MAG: GNAT family N-acetyltransferase [Lutibacter sp.]|jgi:diamine N-acetyltransferase|nr:GNAT family N-acetyltransferase [Lutibacter sp.]